MFADALVADVLIPAGPWPHPVIGGGAALVAATLAAVYDVKSRRIPNPLAAGALVGGLALHGVLGGLAEAGTAALAGLLAGGVFFAFYLAGGMGAGDVKLMAGVGSLAGMTGLSMLLLWTALCGAALAVAIAVWHGRLRQTFAHAALLVGHHRQHGLRPHEALHARNPDALRMPFAAPIAAGCLLSLCMQMGRS